MKFQLRFGPFAMFFHDFMLVWATVLLCNNETPPKPALITGGVGVKEGRIMFFIEFCTLPCPSPHPLPIPTLRDHQPHIHFRGPHIHFSGVSTHAATPTQPKHTPAYSLTKRQPTATGPRLLARVPSLTRPSRFNCFITRSSSNPDFWFPRNCLPSS